MPGLDYKALDKTPDLSVLLPGLHLSEAEALWPRLLDPFAEGIEEALEDFFLAMDLPLSSDLCLIRFHSDDDQFTQV